ncbi:MAG: glycosyltransferase family 9 protein [Desulfuromonadales bacterium]|nr:glycosyltransferase family 9 protein [Desulfuromonadales bacterium]
MSKKLLKSPPKTVLICSFRRIGDVLFPTAIAKSIKSAFPGTEIDYVVAEDTKSILSKNPLLREVIGVPRQAKWRDIKHLFRKYDLAIAAYSSDRTAIMAALAGKKSIGLIEKGLKGFWKRFILSRVAFKDTNIHVVSSIGSLAKIMGIPFIPEVVVGYDDRDLAEATEKLPASDFILIHPYSVMMFKYWKAEGWRELAAIIRERTPYIPVFTETPFAEDRAYLDEIISDDKEAVLFASSNLNQFAAALTKCKAYIGIDTATTHMAAALKVPTVALFGPSITRYWAPWPQGCQELSPFDANKGIERKEYITVIQRDWDCVPCDKIDCKITKRNKRECMETITAEEVFQELMLLLKNPKNIS